MLRSIASGDDILLASPGRALRRVFEHDTLRLEFVADAVGFGEIFRFLGGLGRMPFDAHPVLIDWHRRMSERPSAMA